MTKTESAERRIIQVDNGIIGPVKPHLRAVKAKKIGDYPGVPAVCLDVAKNYSSTRILGPPICDEFIAIILHMFTEEEASVARHIKPVKRMTAEAVAKLEHRPVEEVSEILERLANEKTILGSFGSGEKKSYFIMPIVPGTFEFVMMRTSEDSLTDWHRRFAELFEDLFDTGFIVDYIKNTAPLIRCLPVDKSIESHPMALPLDRLDEAFGRYKKFAVGLCQCRMSEQITGRGCDKPQEVCTAMGESAEMLIRRGKMRRVEKKEILEIKTEAHARGLITWMMNVNEASGKYGNGSCSCCGCCCGMLRTITQFNVPGVFAPPHFLPIVDYDKCNYCGKCAKACQMGAIIVDTKGKTYTHTTPRCIGCGQCVIACDKKAAIQMRPSKDYRKPSRSWPGLVTKILPSYLRSVWSTWRVYR